MPFNIDGNFSVWGLVQRVKTRSAVLNHRRTMNLVSYTIEDVTLVNKEKTRIFAGFQHFSKFTPQIKRYTRMAEIAEMIYIFGIPDVEPPTIPGITFVPLERFDRLAREWFLVSYGKNFASALVTQEITGTGILDENRVFEGLWTRDASLVEILDQWLARTVDAKIIAPFDDGGAGDNDQTHRQKYTAAMLQRLRENAQKTTRPDYVRKEVEAIMVMEA